MACPPKSAVRPGLSCPYIRHPPPSSLKLKFRVCPKEAWTMSDCRARCRWRLGSAWTDCSGPGVTLLETPSPNSAPSTAPMGIMREAELAAGGGGGGKVSSPPAHCPEGADSGGFQNPVPPPPPWPGTVCPGPVPCPPPVLHRVISPTQPCAVGVAVGQPEGPESCRFPARGVTFGLCVSEAGLPSPQRRGLKADGT